MATTDAPDRHAIYALNFFVAAMQTGFGPFLSVWLFTQRWSLTDVGFALSIGTITSLIFQLPGGMAVDATHHKRRATAVALMALALSALMVAVMPSVHGIWAAQLLHAAASVVLGPAIAALTLTLCGHDSFSDRLGGNARYASLGGAIAAGVFGWVSSRLGEQSIFLIAAALAVPACVALWAVGPPGRCPVEDDHLVHVPPKERGTKPWDLFRDPVMHIFALCVILFHAANAALLPFALGGLSHRGEAAAWVVPAAIVIPQLIVALASPWAGAAARTYGRRTVLLVGFLALPLRALLFAANPGPVAVELIQVLDGVSATVLGLMLPLIAADLTRRSGHLNFAMSCFGLAAGLGATLSTTVAGWVADQLGPSMAFLGLAAVGGLATLLLFVAMPETRPVREVGAPVAAPA